MIEHNEVINQIFERLEARRLEYEKASENPSFEFPQKMYYKGVMRGYEYSKDVVQEVAKEYDAFDVIYKKVCELEGEYAESGDIENVNRCIQLQNLLQYFKEELKAPYQKGE